MTQMAVALLQFGVELHRRLKQHIIAYWFFDVLNCQNRVVICHGSDRNIFVFKITKIVQRIKMLLLKEVKMESQISKDLQKDFK